MPGKCNSLSWHCIWKKVMEYWAFTYLYRYGNLMHKMSKTIYDVSITQKVNHVINYQSLWELVTEDKAFKSFTT